MNKTYQELTKNYTFSIDTEKIDEKALQTSALIRIADASEKIALNYIQIVEAKEKAEKDRDYYRKRFQEEKTKVAALEKSRSALRGVVTRLKNQLTNGEK